MKVNKEQFKEFLRGLNFTEAGRYQEDAMYGDLFGDMWIYFSGDKEEISNENYCILNVTKSDVIDLAQFVLYALEVEKKQDVTYCEGW